MKIDAGNNQEGRTFIFTLNGNGRMPAFGSFFANKIQVSVDKKGNAALKILGEDGKICPTGDIKKISTYLKLQKITGIQHESALLQQITSLPMDKQIPLSFFKKMMPATESLFCMVDDGK